MPICVVLRGKHHFDGKWGPLDWKECYQSLKTNFLDYFKNDKIDIYFQTYNSNEKDELIKTYSPKKTVITSTEDGNTQAGNLINILNKIENPSQYNFIITTRFDILYKKPYPEWNIDLNKISIPFFQPNNTLNDCIHIFSPTHLNIFIEKLKMCGENFHRIPIDRKLIHSMEDKRYYSDTDYPQFFPLNNNPFYILHRKRRWGFQNEEQAREVAKRQGFIK